MGKTAQRKISIFNAGRDEAVRKKKERDTPTGWQYEKSDGKWLCPYIPKCSASNLWLLGWRLGWTVGKSAYYKD